VEVLLHSFLTLTLDGNEWWTSEYGLFTPGKEPRYEMEAVSATKPAQSFWRREKSPDPASFVCHYRTLLCIPVK